MHLADIAFEVHINIFISSCFPWKPNHDLSIVGYRKSL